MGNKIKFECKCLYVDVNVTFKSDYGSCKYNSTTEGVNISLTVSNTTATIPSYDDATKTWKAVSAHARCTQCTLTSQVQPGQARPRQAQTGPDRPCQVQPGMTQRQDSSAVFINSPLHGAQRLMQDILLSRLWNLIMKHAQTIHWHNLGEII